MTQDLRSVLDRLEKAGHLRRITEKVSPVFELAAVSRYAQIEEDHRNDVLLFDQVEGSQLRVLANLFSNRTNIAIGMGILEQDLLKRGVQALDRPIAPVLINDAPCQEIIEWEPDLTTLPICQNSEHDGGRYITAGVHITANPATGVRNVGIQRNQVHDPTTLGIWMAPTHMRRHYDLQEAKGQGLPVAICIGVHPAVLIASQFRLGFDEDEMPAAGGLIGEGIEVVKCVSCDIEVPAHSEIVIEGEVLPGERHLEGPFGEYTRQYGIERPLPVVKVKAITRRRDAIYHNVLSARSPEHPMIGALGREPSLFRAVRASVPNLVDVHMPLGSGANPHAWISIRKAAEGEAQKAAFAAFAHQDLVKHVVVVDEDINIRDYAEMDYALATRVRADRDIFIVPRVRSNPLDPAADEYDVGKATVAKMIVDATKPLNALAGAFTMAEVPGDLLEQVRKERNRYFP